MCGIGPISPYDYWKLASPYEERDDECEEELDDEPSDGEPDDYE